jgi:hypothetical protein
VLDLSARDAGTKVVIKCGGNSAMVFDTVGALTHEAHECEWDAKMMSRVFEIKHNKDAEVKLIGITLKNGKGAGLGAGIFTNPGNQAPLGRLKLITKFVKLLDNEATGANGGGAWIDRWCDYEATHTIYEGNKAQDGAAVYLQGRADNADMNHATYEADHCEFHDNVVRASPHGPRALLAACAPPRGF